MRSYRKADGRQLASARKALRRQDVRPEQITAADFARLEQQARRALDRNKQLLDLPEHDRGYEAGVRRSRPVRSPGASRVTR